MSLEDLVASHLRRIAADPRLNTPAALEATLRLLAKWRSQRIDEAMVARHGTVIQAGPFKGMRFVGKTSEASVSPKLIGSYESELHGLIEEIVAAGYDRVVDIGCADGYYAVGFARRIPAATILAFDINPVARDNCAALATANHVADRVSVGGEFKGEDFSGFAQGRTLVLLDAEGAEEHLLDPEAFPGLRRLSVLVECHDCLKAGLSALIAKRFEPTHSVRLIRNDLAALAIPPWLTTASHLDQLLAVWEWRIGPTPWLYLQPLP